MVNENKLESINNAINRIKQDNFYARFFNEDCFTSWLLLDYTRFSIARLRNIELAKIEITPEQAAILQILMRNDGKSTIREISYSWMRQLHSVSTLVRRMEKQGLISIVKYPKRKKLDVVISDRGREMSLLLLMSSAL
jgi:DNA-binding MarR family transcriptional regulator